MIQVWVAQYLMTILCTTFLKYFEPGVDHTPQGAAEDRATTDDLHENLAPSTTARDSYEQDEALARRLWQEENEQIVRERADQERLDRLFAERLQLEENQGLQQPS